MTINDVQKLVFNGKKITRSSTFGRRTYYYNGRYITDYHLGWDFVYREKGKLKSTDVFAINEGVVYKVGKDNVSGNYIYIEYPTLGILLFYCHLKKIYLKKNAKVIKGTKVGLTGTTGNSTGIHLHLGVKLINSNVWLNPSYISLTSYNYSYMASEYLKSYSKRSEYAVNFRREAGLNGSVIEIINKGSLVVVLKENAYVVDGYKWDKVKYNNKEGYVANKYFNDYIRVTTTTVNARIRPSVSKTIVKTFNKGKKLVVINRKYKKEDNLFFDRIKI